LSATLKDGKTLQIVTDGAGAAFEDVQSVIQAAPEVEMHAIIHCLLDDGTTPQGKCRLVVGRSL